MGGDGHTEPRSGPCPQLGERGQEGAFGLRLWRVHVQFKTSAERS